MPGLSRRAMIAAGAAGGLAARAAVAAPQDRSPSNPGPRDPALAALNPSAFTPPPTDHGDVFAFKYPFSVAHTRDSRNFKAAKTISAALVEVEPGGLRKLHWHPNADE